MTSFLVHNAASASEAAKPLLEQVKKQFGFIPNIFGVMAESPALLKAYIEVSEAFANSSLSPLEQQIVLLTVSRENACDYCLAAHSAVADMSKIPTEITDAIRDNKTIDDTKLQALRVFTSKIVNQRGWLDTQETDNFLAAGYNKQSIQDVITGIGQKTLSNYNNHLASTPLDEAFDGRKWEKPTAK